MDLNCYNFSSQDVFLTEPNPSHITVTKDNKLIIVYQTIGFIKIYPLTTCSQQSKPIEPIVTVPLIESSVKQLIHSDVGNYLVIFGDNQSDINSKTVRVYCNYWIEEQPIRIRPFGSLSNRNNQNDYNIRETIVPEVIEINDPLIGREAQYIACCESSANLSILCGFRVLLYCYQTYKYSKNILKTDFIFLLDIKLHWFATKLVFLEHYIALMSQSHLSLLSIIFDYDEQNVQNFDLKHNNISDGESASSNTLDNKCIEWHFDDKSKTIRLPSMFGISDRQQVRDNNMIHSEQVIGPVDQSLSCKFTINMNHSHVDTPICRASIEVLLCQYFLSGDSLIDIDLICYHKIRHYTTDPLNASTLTSSEVNSAKMINPSIFRSSNELIGSALIVVTKTDFYYYNIYNRVELSQKIKFNNQIKSFSMNKSDDTLHLLTDEGLQTYGFNYLPLFLDYKKSVPVLRLNLRTFLNVDYLLNTRNYLLLVTQMENKKRTIYSLRRPTLRELSSDINELISDTNIKLEDQFNIMSYLNSVLHFACNLNAETDSDIVSSYQNSCANLVNILLDVKHYNLKDTSTQKLVLNMINSAKLEFSDLIRLKMRSKVILELVRERLESNSRFDISECELSSLNNFLIGLYSEDLTLFCRLALSQTLEYQVRQTIINLLENSVNSQLCLITLSKLIFDNNDISLATNYLLDLDQNCGIAILCENSKFLFHNNCFILFLQNTLPNLFYQFLLQLVEQNKSVRLVYKMLEECQISIRHNFLISSYNQYRNLFDCQLIVELIGTNVQLLCIECVERNKSPNNLIKSIDKKMVSWIELLPPYHTENHCFCIKCNQITSELYILLYDSINEQTVKIQVNNLFNTIDQKYEWLFTARLLSMELIEAIELILNHFPDIVLPYVKDVCSENPDLIKQIMHLLQSKVVNIDQLDVNSHIGLLFSYTFNQLALSVSPEQFISILPEDWREFAMIYVEKCVINFQAKNLKEKIINLGLEVKSMLSS